MINNKVLLYSTGNYTQYPVIPIAEKNLKNNLLLFGCWVLSSSLQLHEQQHTRLPCPSLSPWVCSNSFPLSQWCHPTISSSVTPFSSHLQKFLASGFIQVILHIRWLNYWSYSFNISPSNESSGLISLGWTGWISLQSKGVSRVFSKMTVQNRQFFGAQLSL